MAKNYWLFKSEPDEYSIDDLGKDKNQTTHWDGVRNYQARNFIRDDMKQGDFVLYYHSNSDPKVVAGYCEIVKEGYPDFTQFDPENKHYDEKADPDNPRWFMVDIKLIEKFHTPVTLESIKGNKKLSEMRLVQRGNRLSVMPVTKEEFNEIIKMSNV